MTTHALALVARRTVLATLLVLVLVLAYTSICVYGDPDPQWMNLFSGDSTFLGQPVPVGAVVTAHDPEGVQCGEFIVHTAGKYGYMPCYRDDPITPEDEGPEPGEPIAFKINGLPATAVPISLNGTPVDPSTTVTWTGLGDLWEVDLRVPSPVGGVTAPPNRMRLLAPWLGLIALTPLALLGGALIKGRMN